MQISWAFRGESKLVPFDRGHPDNHTTRLFSVGVGMDKMTMTRKYSTTDSTGQP